MLRLLLVYGSIARLVGGLEGSGNSCRSEDTATAPNMRSMDDDLLPILGHGAASRRSGYF
jgi:hypothetical protein